MRDDPDQAATPLGEMRNTQNTGVLLPISLPSDNDSGV